MGDQLDLATVNPHPFMKGFLGVAGRDPARNLAETFIGRTLVRKIAMIPLTTRLSHQQAVINAGAKFPDIQRVQISPLFRKSPFAQAIRKLCIRY